MLFGQGPAFSQPPLTVEHQGGGVDSLFLNTDSANIVYSNPEVMVIDTGSAPAAAREPKGNFLDDIIDGKNKDSLVYNLKQRKVYIYKEGEIEYQDMALKGDIMEIDMRTKQVFAHGIADSLGKQTRPEFIQGNSSYTMDTIHYNLDSKKAKIKGVATQEGEGFLLGNTIKRMPDKSIHIHDGKYTTCDDLNCPHFYIEMSKAKMIPGQKVVIGPSYIVLEEVPLYFLTLPFGFFPINPDRHSGFIMPSYGEERVKGFFLRDGGYYFAFNDYVDMTLTGSIYTLGSWDLAGSSRYLKRYSYSGGVNAHYSKAVIGEKGSADHMTSSQFQLQWTHTQDPRFRPNSTFSASVNFTTAGYNKYSATTLDNMLNTQTNSTISYSKNWSGKPFSLATSMSVSQTSRDSTIMLTLPNLSFNVSKIFPFQRREVVGKLRWYEKISMNYTGTTNASVTEKEKDILTKKTLEDLNTGVNHTIPISTSLNILKYITISPSANYQERWYFRKIDKEWNSVKNQQMATDTTYGFYRLFNYSVSVSASTKIYGTYQFKKDAKVQAIRHVVTPSVSFGYTPDFSGNEYGYYKPIQTDANGTIGSYSPYEGSLYGTPGRGKSASMSFSVANTVEAKVKSTADTTGRKIIKIIDNLSASSSWNFLADSLNLAPFALQLRTANLIGNFGINISATLDPYQLDAQGRRINKFMMSKGKPGRITSTGWSFGYTFNSSKKAGAANDINQAGALPTDAASMLANVNSPIDPETRRLYMTQQYYDFSIPWNLGFNYNLSYSKPGHKATTTQTLGFQGSVNLTPKWMINFTGGYDFQSRKLTMGQFSLARDLHCWQMSFSTIPFGFRQSWSFNIGVKSSMLRDLKYDKSSSFYDNLF